MRKVIAIIVASAFTLSGCGTIIGGGTDQVRVRAEPSSARVDIPGQASAQSTPATLSVERGGSYQLEISADGYETETIQLESDLRVGILVGDIMFGFLPAIIDAATGNLKEVEPSNVSVTLEPTTAMADPVDVRITSEGSDVEVQADRTVTIEVRRIE